MFVPKVRIGETSLFPFPFFFFSFFLFLHAALMMSADQPKVSFCPHGCSIEPFLTASVPVLAGKRRVLLCVCVSVREDPSRRSRGPRNRSRAFVECI